MAYELSERLILLSKPRIRNDFYHVRKEYLATDRDPTNSGIYNPNILTHEPSERLKQLALYKGDYYRPGRPGEENTQTRINSARQKTNFQMPPAPYTIVPEKAKKFETTDRLRSLSAPRIRTEYHLRKEYSDRDRDPTNSGIYNPAVLKAEPTDRLKELARHKGQYKNYIFAKPVIRDVSTAAKNFATTERLSDLCIPFPHKRSQKFVRIF